MKRSSWFTLAAGIVLVAPARHAIAQDTTAATGLEEVVVTARKRDESIQDIPLTVQAFSTAQIEERGAGSLVDLAKFAPGLTMNLGSSRAAADFSIRGMAQISPVGDNRKDLVTTFIDGVPYVGNPQGIGTQDIARVEVIKGPQSALFGRATFGGAINLITTNPGNEFKGRAGITAATYGDYRIQGSIEGPLVQDKLSARLLVEGSTFDGFYRNDFGGRLGESDRLYGAITLNFTPIEDLAIRLRYSKRKDEDGPAATALIARYTEHNCGPFPNFQTRSLFGLPAGMTLAQSRRVFCGELRAPPSVGVTIKLPANTSPLVPRTDFGLDLEHYLGSLSADWTFRGGYTLSAIVSKQEQNLDILRDFELAPEDRYNSYSTNDQTQDTYEVRLTSPSDGRLTWMLGAARLETTFDTIGAFINGNLFGAGSGGPASAAAFAPLRSSSTADSIFGSIGFKFTDAFDVSLEARRQEDIQTSGVGLSTQVSIKTPATLPRVLARYALNEETNLFVNYAKGNQPTQGYAIFFQLTPAQQTVAQANGVNPSASESSVKNYEFGVKHRSADGRWYANASVYYLDWTGRQGLRTFNVDLNGDGIITVLPAPLGEVFNVVPFSAGDSNTRGLEIDGAVKLGDRLTLGGSAAYADSKITKAVNETIPLRYLGITDAKGFEFPLVPKFSAAAYGQYEAPLTESRRWFARADVTYIGKRYDSIANFAWVPGQVRTNLRGGLRDDKWDVAVFVNNLFDDDTLEACRNQGDSAADPFFFQLYSCEAVLPNKRQVGVTATWRF